MGQRLPPMILGPAMLAAFAAMLALLVYLGNAPPPRRTVDKAPDDEQPIDPAALEIDSALIQYEQRAEIATGLGEPHALAVGPDDHVYVGGERAIRRFAPDGARAAEIATESTPRCLAVGGADHVAPGRIYAGMDEHVEVYDAAGARIAGWKTLGPKAIVTSIAAADQDVFVADAGNRIVWRFDPSGELKGRIGQPDRARKVPGFVITSRYFDLAVGADGLLYVVNPRALRLEGYTFGGDRECFWGKGSSQVEGFFGCCNPAHFAVLPDGRFVTAEKGIPRIKIYSPQGGFECVVAGPRQMGVAADVAADRRGRVLALDASSGIVRIFERKR